MVGWQRAVQSARDFDTWVICAPDVSKAGIDEHRRTHGPIEGLEFVYVSKPRWMKVLEAMPGAFYLSYNLWQRRAASVARRLDHSVHFDLAHQVNMCGYREPGYLWKLEIPFVWGPVGGTQNYPNRFLRHAGLVGGAKEAVRTILNEATMWGSVRVRRAARRAAALRAANSTVARDLERVLGGNSIEVMLEVGSPQVVPIARPPDADRSGPLRVFWAGQFHAFKALPQLLDALARLPADVEWELTIAGDGPERSRWRRRARKLEIEDRITWLGWVEHDAMGNLFLESDVFVFTSLRDTTGSVVLEALAAGVPVVAPDHQGVGDVVNDDCGVLIPVTDYGTMVDGYRAAILRLATSPDELERLRSGALARADYYSWERQGRRMSDLYAGVIARTNEENQ
jgi:glycosyltransferase involved in cell wall biosynthesis